MARASRPPGFDMTYRPEATTFAAPLAARLPSLVYLSLALAFGLVVLVGERSGSGTLLFQYVVVEDTRRLMSIRTFAWVLVGSALAFVVRGSMRGVRIYPDGVEARDVLGGMVPKLRRYRWPQIQRILLDLPEGVALDLWDGSTAVLPAVGDQAALAAALEQVALARAIPVRGGSEPPPDDPADD